MNTSHFTFKQKSNDFIVEEKLPFALSGDGDFLYVFFEKRNRTTQDILDHLTQHCKVSRQMLWIAGLKDKKAITRQRITISKKNMKNCGGVKGFIKTLGTITRIIESTRHPEPISMSTPIANVFHIRLRAKEALWQTTKTAILTSLNAFLSTGCANLFGSQRFGIEGRNRRQGLEILQGKLRMNEKKELVFKLQAYASKLFNEYLVSRQDPKTGKIALLDGDIILLQTPVEWSTYGIYNSQSKHVTLIEPIKNEAFFQQPKLRSTTIPFESKTMIPTGPLLWYNMLSAPTTTAAGKKEQTLLEKHHLTQKLLAPYKQHMVYGLRRPMRVTPFAITTGFQNSDLLITFALPSGSYASVVTDEMIKKLQRV